MARETQFRSKALFWGYPTVNTKSTPRNKGPFKVKEVLPHSKFLIQAIDGTFEAPANFLKRASLKSGEQLASMLTDTADEDNDDDEEHVDLRDATYLPPIEIISDEEDTPVPSPSRVQRTTRSGRQVKTPQRFSEM